MGTANRTQLLSARRGEDSVRTLVETRSFRDPQLRTVQTSVSRHNGSRTVLEAGRRGPLERVVDKLRTVSQPEFDGFGASGDCVV